MSTQPGHKRRIVRRVRQSLLFLTLLVVAFWGYENWRADNFTFAWSRPVETLVVAVVGPETDAAEEARSGFVQRFLASPVPSDGNLAGVAEWLQAEYERHTGRSEPPLRFTTRGPIQARAAPPRPPSSEDGFWQRFQGTRAFLEYFENLAKAENLRMSAYDTVVFVYFYDEEEAGRYAGQHSVALRRHRCGVVFSPLGGGHGERSALLLAHELCHTLGATDKYTGEQSLFPDGFADPGRDPLYPQDRAEVMALGIPVGPNQERRADDLAECVVGKRTAQEIGWIKSLSQ